MILLAVLIMLGLIALVSFFIYLGNRIFESDNDKLYRRVRRLQSKHKYKNIYGVTLYEPLVLSDNTIIKAEILRLSSDNVKKVYINDREVRTRGILDKANKYLDEYEQKNQGKD